MIERIKDTMFQIFVDSAANLPAVIAKQYNINVISFVNLVSGKEITCYNPDLSPEEEREKGSEYYNAMRKGCEIKTGLISIATFKEKFQKATKEYPDYVLSQEDISFFDKDQFYLFKRGEVIAFDTDYLTSLKSLRKNNHSVDDTVNVLVSIFNKMVKNVK